MMANAQLLLVGVILTILLYQKTLKKH
jgi:hypothetical protein